MPNIWTTSRERKIPPEMEAVGKRLEPELAASEKCNNSSGRLYNPAYIRLVRRCQPLALPDNVGRALDVTVSHPQRVAKQALTTLVATMQSGVTARFPNLRQLLVEAEARGAITPLLLGLFVRANRRQPYPVCRRCNGRSHGLRLVPPPLSTTILCGPRDDRSGTR